MTHGPCDSVIILVNMNYSIVCGRINAYQRGLSAAFQLSIINPTVTIEDAYVSGLSLTHGVAGERKHVWTFAGALDEISIPMSAFCPCTNSTFIWPYQLPSYTGDSYFCDTGAHSYVSPVTLYMDDPLWDGEGCGGSSTCYSYNNPPWFCKHLKYHTSDNLELRLCSYYSSFYNDKLISLVEIYVK